MKQILKLTLYIPLAFIATWFFYCIGYGLYECIVDRLHVLARGWNLIGIPFACGFNYLLFSRNVRLFSYPLWSILFFYAYDTLKWNTPYYQFETITTIGCLVLSLVFIWATRKKESPICHWSGFKRLLFFILCSVIICGIGALSEEGRKAIDSFKRKQELRRNVLEEQDSKDMYANECYDNDNLDLDSLVLTIFPSADSFTKEISSIGFKPVFSSYSEDGKARLFSVHCGGTMCSGTSYILYKKEDNSCVVKKIAYMKPAEEGGMDCPALYTRIQDCENGYYALGRFSFSSTDSVFQDTLFISKEFLEAEEFCLGN